MRPIRLSHTRNLACPEKHQRLYQLGEEEPKADYTQWGTMMHLIAENYVRELSRYGLARSTKMYIKIFNDHTKLIDNMSVLEDMMAIGENYVRYFQIDSRVEVNHCEVEMAVNRNYEVIPIADALDGAGLAQEDCFTGIADYMGSFFGGERALHWEYKFGNQMFDMFEAQENMQIKGYAYLWFKRDIRCQHIASTLYAPKFSQISMGCFERDRLVPEFEAHLDEQWAKADALRAEFGDGPWPAVANLAQACNYCRLYPYCQRKLDVIEKWKSKQAG